MKIKKILMLSIVSMLIALIVPSSYVFAQSIAATPTSSTVIIDGKAVAFEAYNINDSNYFKIRDLAYVLRGTEKEFYVYWNGANNTINLNSGGSDYWGSYSMATSSAGNKMAAPTTSKVLFDGNPYALTAYNIDGNNYFGLRDVGRMLGFSVDWDAASNSIIIDTSIANSFGEVLAGYEGEQYGDCRYALYDIDGNGVDEMLVSYLAMNGGRASDEYTIIYSNANEKVYKIGEFWTRKSLVLVKDGNCYIVGSGGASHTTYEAARISDNGNALVVTDVWKHYVEYDMKTGEFDEIITHISKDGERAISQSEYDAVTQKIYNVTEYLTNSLNWQPKSAYPNN